MSERGAGDWCDGGRWKVLSAGERIDNQRLGAATVEEWVVRQDGLEGEKGRSQLASMLVKQ